MTPRRVLGVLAVAELLAMAPWFSASAVAPTLARVWQLSSVTTAWLTISVQLGFVGGALVSAIFTLADRLSARRLVAGSAAVAAVATLGVALSSGITMGIVCRLLTGAALLTVLDLYDSCLQKRTPYRTRWGRQLTRFLPEGNG